ncbi:glycosyltransferase [Paenibacillus amylolyticus]|uniref:glycosyltransferase n=1 Tax=Paenibacillus amylolyticus TaxID=1451 RepID=UPI003EBC9FA3
MKISIIIPIHNSEEYLRECLESLSMQDLYDVEFICIDDNSTDSSREILQEYADRDQRFRLINDPDGSYGHKINRGIAEAKGKYIGIVESDDKVSLNMFSTLYSYAEEYQVDFIKSNYYTFITISEGTLQTITNVVNNSTLYGEALDISSNHQLITIKSGTGIWSGIYNREFLLDNHISLNETPGASYQDTGFNFFVALHARRAYFLNTPLYWYRTDNVSSSVKDERKAMMIREEFRLIVEKLENNNLLINEVLSLIATRKFTAYWWNITRLSLENRIVFINAVLEEILGDINNNLVIWSELSSEACIFYKGLLEGESKALDDLKNREQYVKRVIIDTFNKIKSNQSLILFGAGIVGISTLGRLISMGKIINSNSVLCLCDNNADLWGRDIQGIPIMAPQEAINNFPDADYIITCNKYADEIKNQLLSLNIKESQILVHDVYGMYTDLAALKGIWMEYYEEM